MSREACSECAKGHHVIGPAPDLGSIRVVESVADWWAAEKEHEVPELHRSATDRIVARYKGFPETVPCSMVGGHPHQKGVIIRTFCGKTMAMGYDCGEQYIDGFDRILARLNAEERYASDIESFETFLRDFPVRKKRIRELLDARRLLRNQIRDELPELYEHLTRRALQGPRGREVIITGRLASFADSDRKVDTSQRLELAGLELFGTHPDPNAIHRGIDLHADAATLVMRLSAKDVSEAETKARKAEDFIAATAKFLSVANLKLALTVLREDRAKCQVSGGVLVVGYDGRESRLSLPDVPLSRSQ